MAAARQRGPTYDAIQSGASSFMMPRRRLYSPAGDSQSPGSAKRAYDNSCQCAWFASVTSFGTCRVEPFSELRDEPPRVFAIMLVNSV